MAMSKAAPPGDYGRHARALCGMEIPRPGRTAVFWGAVLTGARISGQCAAPSAADAPRPD